MKRKFTSLKSISFIGLVLFGWMGSAAAEEVAPSSVDTKGLTQALDKIALKFHGTFQMDGRFGVKDRQGATADTLIFRTIRPILEGRLPLGVSFRVMPDFGQGTTTLQDAYFDFDTYPELKVRLGKFKTPFGLERLQADPDLIFVERSQANGLVPNRDLGLQLFGTLFQDGLSYAFGVFNGVVDGGSGDLDTNDAKDFAGRLFVKPFRWTSWAALKDVGFGFASTWGDHKGTLKSPTLPSYLTPGLQTMISFNNDGTAAGTALADGAVFRMSPQGYAYVGPFGIMADYVRVRERLTQGSNTINVVNSAWEVTATALLTGENATYTSVKPKHAFSWNDGTIGALELAIRYDEANYDGNMLTLFSNVSKSIRRSRGGYVGINWYVSENVKFSANYIHTWLSGGAASAAGYDRTEQVFFSRAQFAF